MKKATIGQQVTALLAGAMRGAVVTEVFADGSIRVTCHCPRGTDFIVPKGKWQDSVQWNNPKTRMI